MFKKSLILVLFTIAIILSLSSTSNRVHATSGPTNLALNLHPNTTEFPKLAASFTCCSDNVWNAVDGSYSANRWTNWGSPNGTDSFTIDFGSAKAFNQVKLYIYNDTGGVHPPASYTIQYWNGAHWVDTTHQTKTPETPEAAIYTGTTTPESILNTDNFDTVLSQKLQVIFTNKSVNSFSGVVEIEVFNIQSLIRTIATANVIYDEAVVGTLVGQYSSDAKAALDAAIVVAQSVADDPDADQTSLDAADAALNSAISTFESTVVPLESFYSAFNNEAGHVITLYVSNILDTSYTIIPTNFKIYDDANHYYTISSVSRNELDNTISLTLTAPLPVEITSFHVKLLKDAFKTNQGELSSSIDNIPIIQANQLDLNNDHRFGIDDLILLLSSNSSLRDINHDGTPDKNDIQILLKQIMPMFASN